MKLFTDISKWQGAVDFAKMKAAGVEGVIARAGSIDNLSGVCYEDYQFQRNADLAPQYFNYVAFYWFLRLNHDPIKQADYYCNLVAGKKYKWLEADIEVSGNVAGLFTFMNRIAANLPGVFQVIYTNPNTWLYLLTGDRGPAIAYDLHEAHWGTETPMPLDPWKTAGRAAVIHQFSAEGNGLGQTYGAPPPPAADDDIDLNHVDETWLAQFAPPPPPAIPAVVQVTGQLVAIRRTPDGSISGSTWINRKFDVVGESGNYYEIRAYVPKANVKAV